MNSTYTLAYAVKNMRNEKDAAKIYGAMPWPEVQARVQRYLRLPEAAARSSAGRSSSGRVTYSPCPPSASTTLS